MTLARPHALPLLFALALATAGAARAQVELPPPPDSAAVPAEAGREDGRLYAGRPGTGGYFAGGFAAGFPIGLFGIAAGIAGETVPVVSTLGGVAGGIAALRHAERPTRDLPPEVEQRLAGRDPAYREAFSQAYSARLRSRRRTAVLVGGLSGTGAGFVMLIHLLSKVYT
jgi:hypothetical protein